MMKGLFEPKILTDNKVTEVSTTRLLEDTGSGLPFTPLQDPSWNLMLWLDAADRDSMDKGTTFGSAGRRRTMEAKYNFGGIKVVMVFYAVRSSGVLQNMRQIQ